MTNKIWYKWTKEELEELPFRDPVYEVDQKYSNILLLPTNTIENDYSYSLLIGCFSKIPDKKIGYATQNILGNRMTITISKFGIINMHSLGYTLVASNDSLT